MTPVVIIKSRRTEDEERVEAEAQLLNSSKAYFAIVEPLHEGDHVKLPDLRGGSVVKVVAELVQHPMPASMTSSFGGPNGYVEVHWGRRSQHVRHPLGD